MNMIHQYRHSIHLTTVHDCFSHPCSTITHLIVNLDSAASIGRQQDLVALLELGRNDLALLLIC